MGPRTPIKTIDDLIAELQQIRERAGGDCPVMLRTFGQGLLHVHCVLGATGKADVTRRVSRGGNACVFLSE